MKRTFFLLVILNVLSGQFALSQDMSGQWYGALDIMGNSIPLVFHFEKHQDGLTATFDSPEQQAIGIPFSSAQIQDSEVTLRAASLAVLYEGQVRDDAIIGTWHQSGRSFSLNLSREPIWIEVPNRPQEPVRPFPYREERVRFRNFADEIVLSGTLTLPATNPPHAAVILISGSGAQNRNQEIYGHKPFLVLADYLTRRGIAVLRYDDRGTAESTGNFESATSRDFADDVRAAVDFLRGRVEIDSHRIGLVGHSEGAIIAPMVAANEDSMAQNIAFLVLLAGPAIPGREVALMQANSPQSGNLFANQSQAYRAFNQKWIQIATSDLTLSEKSDALTQHMRDYRTAIVRVLPEGTDIDFYIRQQVSRALTPWMQVFYEHDPSADLARITIPVLALYGSRDVQVDPEINLQSTKQALDRAGNKNATVLKLDGLNHMFQDSETGLVDEYSTIEQTFSPRAMRIISSWILSTTAQ